MSNGKTAEAQDRINPYMNRPENQERFDSVEGSRDWVAMQVVLVGGQLLENMPRLTPAYDLIRLAGVFDSMVNRVNDSGAGQVLDFLVEHTENVMQVIPEARPTDYEKYSKTFLRDVFKIIYNLEEVK